MLSFRNLPTNRLSARFFQPHVEVLEGRRLPATIVTGLGVTNLYETFDDVQPQSSTSLTFLPTSFDDVCTGGKVPTGMTLPLGQPLFHHAFSPTMYPYLQPNAGTTTPQSSQNTAQALYLFTDTLSSVSDTVTFPGLDPATDAVRGASVDVLFGGSATFIGTNGSETRSAGLPGWNPCSASALDVLPSGQNLGAITSIVLAGGPGRAVDNLQVLVGDPLPGHDDSFTVLRDSSANPFDVLVNDYPVGQTPDGSLDIVRAGTATAPGSTEQGGTVSVTADAQWILYTPPAGYVGPDSFQYTFTDAAGNRNTATVDIKVHAAAPLAKDAFYYVADRLALDASGNVIPLTEDAAHGLGQYASDADGDQLTFAVQSQPAGGSVTVNPDGSFTYTGTGDGLNGATDSFVYTVTDGAFTTSAAVEVGPSQPPVAADGHLPAGPADASGQFPAYAAFEADRLFGPRTITGNLADNTPGGDHLTYWLDPRASGWQVTSNSVDSVGTYTGTYTDPQTKEPEVERVNLLSDGSFTLWFTGPYPPSSVGAILTTSFQFLVVDEFGAVSSNAGTETIRIQDNLPPQIIQNDAISYNWPGAFANQGAGDLIRGANAGLSSFVFVYDSQLLDWFRADAYPPVQYTQYLTVDVVPPKLGRFRQMEDGSFFYSPFDPDNFRGDSFTFTVNDGWVQASDSPIKVTISHGDVDNTSSPNQDLFSPTSATVNDGVGGLPVRLDSPAGTILGNLEPFLPSPAQSNQANPYGWPPGRGTQDFPLGFFSFTVKPSTPGGSTIVVLRYPGGLRPQEYWSYDQTSQSWYNFAYDGQTGAEFGPDNTIILHFVDGQRGDEDGMPIGGPAVVLPDFDDLIGPSGYGTANFIPGQAVLSYRINFANSPMATAPAQRAEVVEQVDGNLDWSTLEFTGAGFGNQAITVPAGSQSYHTTVDLDQDVQVAIALTFDPHSGQIDAVFQALDPATGQPPPFLTGFLPPEEGSGQGQGYITYRVKPRSGLASGAVIRSVATISVGAVSTTTDQVNPYIPSLGADPARKALVTIDASAPGSEVSIDFAGSTLNDFGIYPAAFTVDWSGSDDQSGSGIASYDIYVSDNGGAFQLWKHVQPTGPFLDPHLMASFPFTGTDGHSYDFFSVATDNVGHRQPTPAVQTSAFVDATPPGTMFTSGPATLGSSTGATFTFSGSDNLAPASSLGFQTSLDNGAWTNATSPLTLVNLPPGKHALRVQATDWAGNVTTAPAEYDWTVTAVPVPRPRVSHAVAQTRARLSSVHHAVRVRPTHPPAAATHPVETGRRPPGRKGTVFTAQATIRVPPPQSVAADLVFDLYAALARRDRTTATRAWADLLDGVEARRL